MADGRLRLALVVVARPDGGVVRQGEQLLRDAAIKRVSTAGLKIGAATTIDEQGVAGEHVYRRARAAVAALGRPPDKTHAAFGVAGRVQYRNVFAAKRQMVAVLKLHQRRGDAAARRGSRFGPGVFGQLPGAGDVVGVGMGLDRPGEF